MNISVASDHAGFDLKCSVMEVLERLGCNVLDRGAYNKDSCDYPDFAKLVTQDIINSVSKYGVLICNSGIGMSIVANKYKKIRAALCYNKEAAQLAREHNDANILCLGSKFITQSDIEDVIKSFIYTNFDYEERHVKRLNKFV